MLAVSSLGAYRYAFNSSDVTYICPGVCFCVTLFDLASKTTGRRPLIGDEVVFRCLLFADSGDCGKEAFVYASSGLRCYSSAP